MTFVVIFTFCVCVSYIEGVDNNLRSYSFLKLMAKDIALQCRGQKETFHYSWRM